ncbi:hypothetical protein [Plantactinospora sp. KLBMP9567]|uniref:hypothetical protein n=1 Tax=Plantactinospora sp. KLBMP9567 TaxID=3085900 RepID=UPI0029827F95|nr:hypothetical protein [Plantactinospora sp. KLBMP9567]MDW5326713.1 hypothetical protein [Plantactinospora sp. KLBMP9567]
MLALSYGERGESGELWKDPDQTIENVKRIRHEEAQRAAEAVGASFEAFDLGDYPLRIREAEAFQRLIPLRGVRPGGLPATDPGGRGVPAAHPERGPYAVTGPSAGEAGPRARPVAGEPRHDGYGIRAAEESAG